MTLLELIRRGFPLPFAARERQTWQLGGSPLPGWRPAAPGFAAPSSDNLVVRQAPHWLSVQNALSGGHYYPFPCPIMQGQPRFTQPYQIPRPSGAGQHYGYSGQPVGAYEKGTDPYSGAF